MTKSKFLDPKKVALHQILDFFENPFGSYNFGSNAGVSQVAYYLSYLAFLCRFE
jgi:hypothetical protein